MSTIWVRRDVTGKVDGWTRLQSPDHDEEIAEDHPDVEAFTSRADDYRLYKSVFVERMSPTEATDFEIALNAHELAKLRLMYHAVEYFVSSHSDFALLHWELTQAFGETRADELLAPGGSA